MISRREFGKIALAGAAGAVLSRPFPSGAAVSAGLQAGVALQGVPKGSAEKLIIRAVKAAANAATDFSWLSKGDRVLLKPVCNSGNAYPATTCPDAVRAMTELLREKGAGKVILADMAGVEWVKLSKDGLRGSTRKLMAKNGLLAAAESAGAELYFPEEHGWDDFFEDGPAPGSGWKAGIMMPKIIQQVDHIVLLPRTSRHMVAGTTLGLKAAVGYLRHDSRLEYHRDAGSFFAKTAGINTVPSLQSKLRLVLTVATKTLATQGPDNGFITEPETGLVFASESLLAHDMVSLAWLLLNRETVPASQKNRLRDPAAENYLLNPAVVLLLGGPEQAAKTQRIENFQLNSVWSEPTLRHACQLFGQTPAVRLLDPDRSLPENLLERLSQMTAPA
jgi:uncharacterized protein (DUF362 family)